MVSSSMARSAAAPLPSANKPWPDLTNDERVAKVRYLESLSLTRTDQATRLGLRLSALSQFCSANGLLAGNDNSSAWRTMSVADKIATIRTMITEEFYSMREIAEELGATVGAVRTFAMRHKIIISARRIRVDGPPMVPAEAVPENTWEPLAGVVSLMDLEDGHCRWPVNGGFCGCAVSRGSYCAVHSEMSRGK